MHNKDVEIKQTIKGDRKSVNILIERLNINELLSIDIKKKLKFLAYHFME